MGVRPGEDVCFYVRARDKVGNLGAWSSPDCATVPYDADDFLPWGSDAAKSKVLYTSDRRALERGGVAILEKKGAAIRRQNLTGRRIAVYVIRGPRQGSVDVSADGRKVGRIKLAASTWRRELVYLPAAEKAWTGTVTIRLVGSAKARIDAIAVLR